MVIQTIGDVAGIPLRLGTMVGGDDIVIARVDDTGIVEEFTPLIVGAARILCLKRERERVKELESDASGAGGGKREHHRVKLDGHTHHSSPKSGRHHDGARQKELIVLP